MRRSDADVRWLALYVIRMLSSADAARLEVDGPRRVFGAILATLEARGWSDEDLARVLVELEGLWLVDELPYSLEVK